MSPVSCVTLSLQSHQIFPSYFSTLLTNVMCHCFNKCTALWSLETLHCHCTAPSTRDTAGLGVKSDGDLKTACLQDQGDRAAAYSPSHLAHNLLIAKKQGLGGGQIWELFDDCFKIKFIFWSRQYHQGKLLISKWIFHSPDLHC